LATGFNKAWSAIADTAVTTLLAGALLFFLASGPVRGFGVTLTIGVLGSLVSAMLLSRVLTDAAAARAPKFTSGKCGGSGGPGRRLRGGVRRRPRRGVLHGPPARHRRRPGGGLRRRFPAGRRAELRRGRHLGPAERPHQRGGEAHPGGPGREGRRSREDPRRADRAQPRQ